jgi:hypothetical protein
MRAQQVLIISSNIRLGLAFLEHYAIAPSIKKTWKHLIVFSQRLLSLAALCWPSARVAHSIFLNIDGK